VRPIILSRMLWSRVLSRARGTLKKRGVCRPQDISVTQSYPFDPGVATLVRWAEALQKPSVHRNIVLRSGSNSLLYDLCSAELMCSNTMEDPDGMGCRSRVEQSTMSRFEDKATSEQDRETQ
jgi:hypothetical protein